jgi:predicted amidohydrolase
MRITLLQDDIFWADKQANLQKTELQLQSLSGKTDLVVLPEMFTTGFCTNRLDLTETMQGETVKRLKRWAIDFDLAIVSSFIVEENGKYYNRGFFVFPNGEIETADKRHLFAMGGEDKLFSTGNKRLIVNYKGFNIFVLVCYDLRFPVWSRNVNNEYDLLIYMASWPTSRIEVWNTLLAARAIENQAYVCGVNRIGEDGENLIYNGSSRLINAKGEEIFFAPLSETSIETIEISTDELHSFRAKFPAWKDADRFRITTCKAEGN